MVTGLNVRRAVPYPLSYDVNLYRTGPLLLVSPSIAQLVERWTVVVHCQISIGRWFKSGSKDFFSLLSFPASCSELICYICFPLASVGTKKNIGS